LAATTISPKAGICQPQLGHINRQCHSSTSFGSYSGLLGGLIETKAWIMLFPAYLMFAVPAERQNCCCARSSTQRQAHLKNIERITSSGKPML
jgi:hypothetical protein